MNSQNRSTRPTNPAVTNPRIAAGASAHRRRRVRNATSFIVVPASQKKFMFVILGGGLLLMTGVSLLSSQHLLGLICLGAGAATIWWGSTED